MTKRVTLLNMISNLILRVVTILSGFIIPKLILSYLGSDTNGLISSIGQFLSYITLVEGGVSGVIMANLYKPLIENDMNKVSSVLKTAKSFYRKVGLVFCLYTIVLAIIYPIVFKTEYSFTYIFSLTLILSFSLLLQYMFSYSQTILLNADKKQYIVSFTHSFCLLLNIVISIIIVRFFPDIHILKLVSGLVFVIQPIVYGAYIHRHYNLDKNAKKDSKLIESRWDGFAINIAYFVHSCTDIALLTIFSDLGTISVYSVYKLVTSGLSQIVNAFTSGLNPTLGRAYASGDYQLTEKYLSMYEYIVFILVFTLFVVAGFLITPFVMIYVKGVTDVDYYQPVFGVLFLVAEGLYLLKYPHLNLAYSANKFKEIRVPAFIEAAINIIISLCLIKPLGLIGIMIGTTTAMLYRLIFHVHYTSNLIPGRKDSIFYKKLLIFAFSSILLSLFFIIMNISIEFTVLSWIFNGFVLFISFGLLYLIISNLFFKKEFFFLKDYLFHRKK